VQSNGGKIAMLQSTDGNAKKEQSVCRWPARTVRLGIVAVVVLIFAVVPLRAQTESVLYSFTGAVVNGPDGASPGGPLLRDANGNLFGTTESGGDSGNGTVFELVNNPPGTYTEKVLHSFGGNAVNDGALPYAGLVMDAKGNLYGVTATGGSSDSGTVFEIVNSGGVYIEEEVLHSFLGALDGAQPIGGLIMDSAGNLFGTTVLGGNSGFGTIFEMVNASGSYSESVLYSFKGDASDGGLPYSGLVIDASGNLYGTTSLGGTSNGGTVFEMTCSAPGNYTCPAPGSYSESVLFNFTGANGGASSPLTGLVLDPSGNLYGTTQFGGASTACGTKFGCGTIFELACSTAGSHACSAPGSYAALPVILHTFTGLASGDGGNPQGLLMDSKGNLFGTTEVGGSSNACAYGCGTVFELLYSSPGNYAESVLYSFPTFSGDGLVPVVGLTIDSAENLYGTTSSGGYTTPSGGGVMTACPFGCGTVFEVVPGPPAPTYMFSATTGSNQSTNVNTAFANPLEVTVLDSSGKPPENPVTVTFTAFPAAGGASGIFANGTATATATTSTSTGVAMASVFTANNTAGTYMVEASAPHVTGTASFTLTNEVVPTQTATMTTFMASSTIGGQNLPSGVALVGNPITVSVTVKPTSGATVPTGTVLVTDGGLGDACTPSPTPLTAGTGTCTLTIATFPSGGITSLSAAYTPNSNAFLSSNSLAATEQVVEGIVGCSAAITPLTVQQKATATETLTVCLAGNLNFGAVPFAVRVLECPKYALCSVIFNSLGSGVYSVNVKIITKGGTGTASLPALPPWSGTGRWPLTPFALGALLTLLVALQRRRPSRVWPRILCTAGLLVALVLGGVSGCNSTSSQHVTPAGTYAVQINVVAGSFSQTVPLNVTVTK
jgi:uncharacterized repeat protein (TIGR03803 family)